MAHATPASIPFLRPNLVKPGKYWKYVESMDQTRLYSNFGPLNSRFEARIRVESFGDNGRVTTVNNATTGLMLAIALTKRSGGRYAVMPSFTFAATPLAAMWAGLEPYFVDVGTEDFAMCPRSLARALAELGDDVAVVVPYATFGVAIDLAAYAELCARGIPVVVDAAASFGTTCGGAHFGTGFPGVLVFSFHATKAFGIGEGGLVYSANHDLIERLRQAANFGFGPDKVARLPGLNAKLPEFAAGIGLALLDEFPERKRRRMDIHEWYRRELAACGMPAEGWTMQGNAGETAHQFFPLLAPEQISNQAVVRSMATHAIELRTYFSPACHEQPAFERFPRSDLTRTQNLSARALSLPLWEEMKPEEVERVVRHLPRK